MEHALMGFLEQRAGLTGKVGVVIGGAGGLGRACADDLAAAGVALAVLDRDADALAATAARAAESGAHVVTVEADARDPEVLTALFGRVDAEFGRLDVLVNVVGGTFRQPFEESNPRGWDALVRTNFSWLLTSIQLAIPRMRAVGGGSIVNFTSIEAHRAAPNFAVYAAMKAAITSLTRTLAVELAPDAIRVNCIAADITPTEGTALASLAAMPEGERRVMAGMTIPMGRVGTYEDTGGCVLFLASDLSKYVTGTTLHPDGGAIASSGWLHWPDAGWSNTPSPEVVALFKDR